MLRARHTWEGLPGGGRGMGARGREAAPTPAHSGPGASGRRGFYWKCDVQLAKSKTCP